MFGGTPKKKTALTSEDRLKRDLKRVMSEPCNKLCADCSALNPTWASINLGVFLCLDCSGIHRMLGVHISQVKLWCMHARRGSSLVDLVEESEGAIIWYKI